MDRGFTCREDRDPMTVLLLELGEECSIFLTSFSEDQEFHGLHLETRKHSLEHLSAECFGHAQREADHRALGFHWPTQFLLQNRLITYLLIEGFLCVACRNVGVCFGGPEVRHGVCMNPNIVAENGEFEKGYGVAKRGEWYEIRVSGYPGIRISDISLFEYSTDVYGSPRSHRRSSFNVSRLLGDSADAQNQGRGAEQRRLRRYLHAAFNPCQRTAHASSVLFRRGGGHVPSSGGEGI